MGVVEILVPWIQVYGFYVYLLFVAVAGILDGISFMLIGPVILEIVGPENVSQGIGFALCTVAFPLGAGPGIVGKQCKLL